MVNTLPPLTYKDLKDLPYVVQEYLRLLRNLVQGTVGAIAWTSVSKTGSNLTDLVTRNHVDLQNKQGGSGTEYYHTTAAQNALIATLTASVYTPTLTGVTNVGASTAYQCQYMRVGSVVTVSGKVDVDPTAAGNTQLGISLPIASNFGAAEDCGGVAHASAIAGQGAGIRADAVNDRAEMIWVAVDITNQPMYFSFTYRIL